MRHTEDAHWRVIYIARDERQAQVIEDLLRDGGFMVDRRRPEADEARIDDIEIKALSAEAEEARLYLMEKGY